MSPAFARREGWTLVAPPRIELHIDEDLRVGEFGIAARTVNEPAETPDEVVAPPAYTPPPAGAAPGSLVDQTILYQEAAAMPAASPAAARGGTPPRRAARPRR